MMRKVALLAAIVALATAGGCTSPIISADRGDGGGVMTLEASNYGWVEVYVAYRSGTLHWGDSYDADSFTQVTGAGIYSYYYGSAGVYAARLLDNTAVVAELTIDVPVVRGIVRLASVDGLTITVTHYAEDELYDRTLGFAERTYWIEWGDGEAMAITSHEYFALGRNRSHTYAAPGTYSVAVRSPGQGTTACFEVTVGPA